MAAQRRSADELLHPYALEGFLARLAAGPHAARMVLTLVQDIANLHLDDGLEFDVDDATAQVIRGEDE